jgi:hypothetical protein
LFFYNKFYFAFGPDFVSYYSIAKHYTNGNFLYALNDWWSPLYSWMLALLLKFNVEPLLANKIVQFAVGWYCFVICKKVILFFIANSATVKNNIVMLSIIPFITYWALFADTPDFIVAALLLHFILNVIRLINKYTTTLALKTSIIGAFCFFAKSFNFYFLITFAVTYILYLLIIKKSRAFTIKRVLQLVLPFASLVLIWALLTYFKTNKLQITSRAEHQLCSVTIAHKPNFVAQPYDCVGLQLDSMSFTSNWEQPQLYKTTSFATAITSNHTLLNKYFSNMLHYIQLYLSKFQLGLLLITLLVCFNWIKPYWFSLLSFAAIYLGAHFLFHLETRFFIMPSLLLMLLAIIGAVKASQKINNYYISLLLLGSAFLVNCKTPILKLYGQKVDDIPQKMSVVARQNNITKAMIAAQKGYYDEGLYLSFYTQSKFVGTLLNNANDSASVLMLKNNNVTHLLLIDTLQRYKIVKLNN